MIIVDTSGWQNTWDICKSKWLERFNLIPLHLTIWTGERGCDDLIFATQKERLVMASNIKNCSSTRVKKRVTIFQNRYAVRSPLKKVKRTVFFFFAYWKKREGECVCVQKLQKFINAVLLHNFELPLAQTLAQGGTWKYYFQLKILQWFQTTPVWVYNKFVIDASFHRWSGSMYPKEGDAY